MTRFPDDVPVLTDGTVRLRAHDPADRPRIVAQARDPEMVRWTLVPRPYGDADADEFLSRAAAGWQADGHRLWAVEEVARPAVFLGSIHLRPRGGGVADVDYGLHPEGRGRGLMARAMRLACRWWFDEQRGVRIHWSAKAGNDASYAVVRACGFTYHGKVPRSLVDGDGQAVDAWTASVGPDDDLSVPTRPWPALPTGAIGALRLRDWRATDVDAVEAFDHPAHFMPVGALPTRANFAARTARRRELRMLGEGLEWCIADVATDRALGWVTVFVNEGTLDTDAAEFGYTLFPSAQGNGYAAVAGRFAVAHAFAPRDRGGLGLRRLVATAAADNVASNRTLERLGFVLFGREREVDVLSDRVVDLLHWDLLAREWSNEGP